MTKPKRQLEGHFLQKLPSLKYAHYPDIDDRDTLDQNFREKFDALNRVRLADGVFPNPQRRIES